jgi:hypothetical protein
MTATSEKGGSRSYSQEQADALLAEVLGDVLTMHRSVKDLGQILDDTDQRITARVGEVRALVTDLAGLRERLVTELSVRAGEEGRRALRESVGEMVERIERIGRWLEQQPLSDARRQWFDRMSVAIVTAAISTGATLAGVALLLHFR